MASCLVPDFPAVMVALEHLKELDKQLKEDGIPFTAEASLHLTEITAAVTNLAAERRAAHEHLEVETIKNSKLRHQINNIRERISQEIMADVAAARESNGEEIEQLRTDLSAASWLREATMREEEAQSAQNVALRPVREKTEARHKKVVAALNDLITLKYSLQIQLNETNEHTEELRASAAAARRKRRTLQQDMVPVREAFNAKKDNLSRDVDQADDKLKQQKLVVKRLRKELGEFEDAKREVNNHLGELKLHMANLESSIESLIASQGQCKKQLEEEIEKHQELRQQREALKKELFELGEAFSAAIQSIQKEIALAEGKIEHGQALGSHHNDALARILEIFKRKHEEEDEVRVDHHQVSMQLDRSKQQLEECIASIVKHSKATKELDKQIGDLLEADTIKRRMFDRSQEEMCGNVDTERTNIGHLKDEKKRLEGVLVEAKRNQVEHVTRITAEISSAKTRYEELRLEEAVLLRRQPKSEDVELLRSHLAQCKANYGQMEAKFQKEIECCGTEAEVMARSNEAKQREVEDEEEKLRQVKAQWSQEQTRHQSLMQMTSELRKKRNQLELSIQCLKEETDNMLRPKECMKAKLEELRASHMDRLDRQASELRYVEISVFNHSVNLEQVNMENSRLHLCIRQMTEDVSNAREDKDRYRQEVDKFKQDIKALFAGLQGAWMEDYWLTQEHQSSDGLLLVSMGDMLEHLETRRHQLGNVNTLLHRQMLDFSKRLGDQTTVQKQSIAKS